MNVDQYLTEAQRLAAHLEARHGIKLRQSSILDAVASLHGAADWRALTGVNIQDADGDRYVRKSAVRRLLDAIQGTLGIGSNTEPTSTTSPSPSPALKSIHVGEHLAPVGIDEGYRLSDDDLVQCSRYLMRQHLLVVGEGRAGSDALVESLLTQHVTMGGSFIVLRAQPDETADARLAAVMHSAGRPLYRFDAGNPQNSHHYDVIGADDASYLRVLELIRPLWQAQASSTFLSAINAAQYPHREGLESVLQGVCSALNHIGHPWRLSDVASLMNSWEARQRILKFVPSVVDMSAEFVNFTKRHHAYPSLAIAEAAAALMAFCDSKEGQLVDGYHFHFDLVSARRERAGVVLSPPERCRASDSQRMRQLFVEDLRAKLQAISYDAADETPLMVVVEDAGELGVAGLQTLVRHAGIKATAFVLKTDSLASWRRHEYALPETMLELCGTHVLFRLPAADVEFLTSLVPAFGSDGGRYEAPALTALERQRYGQAWVNMYSSLMPVSVPQVTFALETFQLPVIPDIADEHQWRPGVPLHVRRWVEANTPRER